MFSLKVSPRTSTRDGTPSAASISARAAAENGRIQSVERASSSPRQTMGPAIGPSSKGLFIALRG